MPVAATVGEGLIRQVFTYSMRENRAQNAEVGSGFTLVCPKGNKVHIPNEDNDFGHVSLLHLEKQCGIRVPRLAALLDTLTSKNAVKILRLKDDIVAFRFTYRRDL